MRILYLTDQLYLHGGAEKILTMKMNYLAENFGFEVLVVTSEHNGDNFVYSVSPKVEHFDLAVNYKRTESYFSIRNLRKTILHYTRLRNKINKYNPDVIISVSFSPDQYFLPFIRKDIPKIKEFHTSGFVRTLSGYKKWLFNTIKSFDRVIVLNKDELNYYPSFRCEVIPNFISPNQYKFENKENVVIAAGRIAPVKQFDVLINIWEKVASEFPDWKLKIFGDGDRQLEEILFQLSRRLGVSNSVILEGPTTDILAEMSKSKLYALTSYTECFPMVLLEAHSCGLPVVSFNIPTGPQHIIRNNVDGLLVENNNEHEFAKALIDLISNDVKRERFSKEARQNIERFEMESIMNQWKDLFITLKNKS